MSNICKIDTTQLDKIFENLSEENRNKAMINSLKEGANVLKENTQQNLIKKLGSGATSTVKYKKPMTEGIGITAEKDYLEVVVSILRDFRLKWFEMGTKERYRKIRGINSKGKKYVKHDEKGGYTGFITGTHFFKEARENTSPIEEAIIRAMEAEINKLMQ